MMRPKDPRAKTGELARVYLFNRPGAQNTSKVIKAVKRRIHSGGISRVLVASESGRLALGLKKVLGKTTVVCVTCNDEARRKYQKPPLMKDQLFKHGIEIVDDVEEPLTHKLSFRNWWEGKTIDLPGQNADLFWMTLICVGGHGLRTAVEIAFMAVEAGAVSVGERVVSVAGTGWGADSAIVMKTSKFDNAVGKEPGKRMKVEEILAMPKVAEWKGYG